jgi:3',5'-cyclic AMP phosphodiesterase CpdA
MKRPFLLAQVTDLHIKAQGQLSYRVVDTVAMLRACVRHILSLKQQPDAVVITGDLTDRGLPEEYALLRELLAPLAMPLYLMPGNHDQRETLRAERGAPDRAGSRRRRALALRDGTAGVPAACVHARVRAGVAHRLCRRFRRALPAR